MRSRTYNPDSVRLLGACLAALTVALPLLLGLLAPEHTRLLVPFALALPFVTMGLLEAASGRRPRVADRAGDEAKTRSSCCAGLQAPAQRLTSSPTDSAWPRGRAA